MKMKLWWLSKVGKVLLFVMLKAVVLGLIVKALWNALIPQLFNGPSLGFWQAVGLLLLSHLLLHGGMLGFGWHRERWRRRFEEKLAAMAPEERDKFKAEWNRRCSWHQVDEEKKQEAKA
jgi:hypothetical protein